VPVLRRRPSNDSRRRVVTLVGRPEVGGAERLAYEITARLDPDRYERTLCVSRPPLSADEDGGFSQMRGALEAAGARVLVLDRSSRSDLLAWRPLIRLLREERIDVLHSHMFGANVAACGLALAARVPVLVAHEHTWSFEGRPLRRLLDRELIARASDAFVAVSDADRRRMIEIEGIDPGDVVHIPNGIAPLPPGDPRWGFLYGWTSFLVIQTGTIAAVAVAFGKFLGVLVPALGTRDAATFPQFAADPAVLWGVGGLNLQLSLPLPWLAQPLVVFSRTEFTVSAGQLVGVAMILALTWWNTRGLTEGKWLQNVFTVAKIGGLIAVIAVGLTLTTNPDVWRANFADPWSGIGGTDQFKKTRRL
jgi:glycosyltransferase involved in cell wall biosynthesis